MNPKSQDPAPLLALLERLLRLRVGRVHFGAQGPPPPPGATFQPFARFNYLLSGRRQAVLPIGGRAEEVLLRPGDVQVSAEGSWEFARFDREHEILCIVPRADYLRVACHRYRFGDDGAIRVESVEQHTVRSVPAALRLAARALCACAGDASPAAGRVLAQALKHQALAELAVPRGEEWRSGAKATFREMRRWMENRIQHWDLGREAVAAAFGVSPSYVSRLFRRQAGVSFVGCLTEQRIAFAETLLATTPLTVQAVAQQCGFRSAAYFVKRFRELRGRTPGAFRQRSAAASEPCQNRAEYPTRNSNPPSF
jgi:AraC-like DNA-binding protein